MTESKRNLAELQMLRLDTKVLWSIQRIIEAVTYAVEHGLTPYISYSGGKDSTVLKHLVHSLFPDIKCVFVNTGLEYPEVVEFARQTVGLVELRPKMNFVEVLEKYGFPVPSKRVATAIRKLRSPGSNHVRTLILTGYTQAGKYAPRFKLAEKWKFLVDAPFLISEKCCDVMKKRPMAKYQKETRGLPLIGTLAVDSEDRKASWQQQGCNVFDGPDSRSMPLSIWTEQDILQYLFDNNLPIAPVYGSIQKCASGCLSMTGEDRTGCIFCLFGIAEEQRKRGCNRFQRMKQTHPQLWSYCMDKLGIRLVMNFLKLPVE